MTDYMMDKLYSTLQFWVWFLKVTIETLYKFQMTLMTVLLWGSTYWYNELTNALTCTCTSVFTISSIMLQITMLKLDINDITFFHVLLKSFRQSFPHLHTAVLCQLQHQCCPRQKDTENHRTPLLYVQGLAGNWTPQEMQWLADYDHQ